MREIKTATKTRLQELMQKENISYRKLANVIGSNAASLNLIANNNANPQASNLIALADFFDCSVDYLLCRTEQKLMADKITPEVIRQQLEDYENLSNVKKEAIRLIKQMNDASVENIRFICAKIVEASSID